MSICVLQISDCHLVVAGAQLIGVDTQASLEAVLTQALSEAAPDAIIATGDIAHDPVPEVYERFCVTLRRFWDGPLMCLPGNHDMLEAMQMAGLPMRPLKLGAWCIVPLDSHEDDRPRALITQADKAAAAAAMAETDAAHCLVATHHPLVEVNCPWLDADRIQNPQELLEWLAECSAINGASRLRSVVFGHAHQAVASKCGALPVYGAPSTCFQFMPHSQKFAVDTTSPGFRWLWLDDDGGIRTQVRRVDSFPINVRLDG